MFQCEFQSSATLEKSKTLKALVKTLATAYLCFGVFVRSKKGRVMEVALEVGENDAGNTPCGDPCDIDCARVCALLDTLVDGHNSDICNSDNTHLELCTTTLDREVAGETFRYNTYSWSMFLCITLSATQDQKVRQET